MVAHPGDEYGSYGSVPSVEAQGGGASLQTEHATPESFGGQVGQAVSGLGKEGEQVTNMFGGMIMETAANQAELNYNKAAGALTAKYQQYEGLQAEAMRPKYEAEMQQLHQQFRGDLPLAAQKMFDATTMRSLGYQTTEYARYAASQVKSANLQSNDAIADLAIAKAGNLPTVLDDHQFGEQEGTILHAVNAVADVKGWASQATGVGKDGRLTFGDSPDAQATKAQYDNYVADKQAKLYSTAAKTIADSQGTIAAANWAQKHWDTMPDAAKVMVNQYLAPKMKNERIESAINAADNQYIAYRYNDVMGNVPDSPTAGKQTIAARNNNPGNLRDTTTGQFRVFKTPEEGAAAMRDDLAAKIGGHSPAMQRNFGENYSPTLSNIISTYAPANENDTKSYINTVSKETGFAPNQVLTASDIPKLQAAMTKVESGGSPTPTQSHPKIPSLFANEAERLEAYKPQYLQSAVKAAADSGIEGYDLQMVERRAELRYNAKIRDAQQQLKTDQQILRSAISGSLTQGQPVPTMDALAQIQGMGDVLDRVHREQPEFYNTLPTLIGKVTNKTSQENSSNGYGAILHVLSKPDPTDPTGGENYLHTYLSRNDQTGITYQDYKDGVEATKLDPVAQMVIAENMKKIAENNGNVDGGGEMRAIAYYHQAVKALQSANNDPNAVMNMTTIGNKDYIGNLAQSFMPSREAMIANKSGKTRQNPGTTFDYNSIKPGDQYTAPDGTVRIKR